MCVYWTENNLLKNKITFTQKSFSVENWETLNIQNITGLIELLRSVLQERMVWIALQVSRYGVRGVTDCSQFNVVLWVIISKQFLS